ncbi:40S ribosomal protein S29 [Ananas comosus]|uniref:40S ribosomal protein S29 n=1 Tax=Ananas comosus TaxID=4615 RepID=A0A199VIG0_ANACO|nr:40S ribosomal protein S29 [Ananas comosus]
MYGTPTLRTMAQDLEFELGIIGNAVKLRTWRFVRALGFRVCGNPHGMIRKYGLMCCRQCFRSHAKDIGFIKSKRRVASAKPQYCPSASVPLSIVHSDYHQLDMWFNGKSRVDSSSFGRLSTIFSNVMNMFKVSIKNMTKLFANEALNADDYARRTSFSQILKHNSLHVVFSMSFY